MLVCGATVLAASAPGLYAASGDLAESQRLVDLAQLDVQAVSIAHSLADERDGVALFIAGGRSQAAASAADISRAQRTRVDGQIKALTSQAIGLNIPDPAGASGVAAAIADATGKLRELPGIRRAALTGKSDAWATVTAYGQVIDGLEGIGAALARALPSRAASADATALPALSRAVDQASVQRGLLAAALTEGGAQRGLVTLARTAAVREEAALADFHSSASPTAADQYDETVTGSDVTAAERDLARLTDALSLSSADQERYKASDVQSALSVRIDLMRGVESSLVAADAARIATVRDDDVVALELRTVLAGGCLLLTAGVLIRTARSVNRRHAADPTAAEPAAPEAPGTADTDTDGKAAAEVAYVNLTLRTLGLVERQLTHLDQLEEVAHDPDELSRLFTLDHLATRMRRNTENLLVLAGSGPPHDGGRPEDVPLLDVARAAVSEIEWYERVQIQALPAVQVVGGAADNLGHLVAELLENAAQFAPPGFEVQLSGRLSDSGELMVFVEDQGIGIPAERRARLNALLTDPGMATIRDGESTGLGMYVVAHLAARHGIRVQLRDHPGGGVTAVVVVPPELVTAAEPDDIGDIPGALLSAAPELSPADGGYRLTAKGLPQRVPAMTGRLSGEHAERPPADGPVDAEALRRKLGGLQQGLLEGRLDVQQEEQQDRQQDSQQDKQQDKQGLERQAESDVKEMALVGTSADRDQHDKTGVQGDGESRGENLEEAYG